MRASGRLDVEALLALGDGADANTPLAAGTRVGHLHFKVASIPRAATFYREQLGFRQSNYAAAVGWADLGEGDLRNHLIALNTWQGTGVPPKPAGMAGLRHATLQYADPQQRASVIEALAASEDVESGVLTCDPDGNRLLISTT